MASFLNEGPLLFLAMALLMLVVAFGIAIELSVIERSQSRGEQNAGKGGFTERFAFMGADPDVTLLVFWATLVIAVVASLIVAVLT